jgi:hypothetical protein
MSMGISGKWTRTARANIARCAAYVCESTRAAVYTVFTEAW